MLSLAEAEPRSRLRNGVAFATASGIETRISWDEIDHEGARFSSRLRWLGMGPQVRLALIGVTSRQLVVAIRAAIEAAIPFVLLAPPDPRRGPLAIAAVHDKLARVAPAFVLCDEPLKELVRADPPADVVVLSFDDVDSLTGREPQGAAPHRRHEPPVLLQFTSGTTGEPRAVAISQRNLTANISGLTRRFRFDPEADRFQSWLPLYHDMGLIGFLLLPMVHGIDLVLSDASYFARSPQLWLSWIDSARATVTCAPQFAYSIVGRIGRAAAGLDLSSVRLALNGAEPVNPDDVRRFQAVVRPRRLVDTAMSCGYGLAEATLGVTAPLPGTGLTTEMIDSQALANTGLARTGGSGSGGKQVEMTLLGQPLAGVELRLVDARGTRLGDREVGEVQVRGESVTSGYWPKNSGSPEATGWLHTGDLGYLVEGQLVICGRKKDVIIIGGKNHSPIEIERAAAQVDGVRDGHVAAFGIEAPGRGTESIVVVAEVRAATDASRRSIESAVVSAVGVKPAEVVLVKRGTVPRTTSGKVQRAACKARYQAGQL